MEEIDFMWDGGDTRRYHGFRFILEDTVGQHSYNVACTIMYLRPAASAKLLRAALKHDMAEHKVGDMPAPTKRDLPDYQSRPIPGDGPASFREVFGKYEEETAKARSVDLEQDLPPDEAWVLKFADSLDGMRFCIRERQLGNSTLRLHEVYAAFKSYVEDLLFDSVCVGCVWDRPMAPHAENRDRELFFQLTERWRMADGNR